MGSMLSEAEGNTGVNKQENRSKDRLLNKCKGKKGKKKEEGPGRAGAGGEK